MTELAAPPLEAEPPERKPALGALLALGSAVAFGGITSFAALAYAEGATPLALVTLRFVLATLVFGAVCLALRLPLLLPRAARRAGWLTGLFWFVASVGYLGSVHYIPVSLAALVFYTFPILTALGEAALVRRRPRAGELALLLLAFAGLGTAIGPSFASLSPLGLGLVALGALGAAGLFLSMREIAVRHAAPTVLVGVNLSAGALSGLAVLLLGGWSLPAPEVGGSVGWAAIAAAVLAYFLAILLHSGAVRHAGPSRSALFFNLEPLVSILCAVLLLGEELTLPQIAGGLLVLTALVLAGRRRR